MAPPVKRRALELGLAVGQPARLREEVDRAPLRAASADLMLVVAYGLILPQVVLDLPRLGCINVHASLLPRWRGAAPIQRAIEAGDHETGITIMQMEAGLDTGPMLLREAVPITDLDTGGSLHDRLATVGARLAVQALEQLAVGPLAATACADQAPIDEASPAARGGYLVPVQLLVWARVGQSALREQACSGPSPSIPARVFPP